VQTELVTRARGGDREAFAALAASRVDRLYAIARLILRDADLAEDAIQEAMLSAWQSLPTLRDVERFDAWLYRLMVNACTAAVRDRRHWQGAVTLLRTEPSETDSASGLADRDQLERGLRALTVAQRTILVLHFYADLPMSGLADALGTPVGTAKSRLHYAIDALRAVLEADERNVPVAAPQGRTA
jgi:RNA polymerase sigma-70 factor (ECF subfamily)